MSIDMTVKTMESTKVTPQYMNIITYGLVIVAVTNEKEMMEMPANSQLIMEATVTALAGIMKLMYGHTLDPSVSPKVNMKNMMKMHVISRM